MVKPVYMAGVVGLGAVLGLGLGWVIWGQSETPDVIVTAFLEERCLPHMQGDESTTDDLIKANIANVTGYVERDRHIVIMFRDNKYGPRCIISDILAHWSEPEREAVLGATRRFATRHIAALNDGLLVEEDVSMEGVGEPLLTWRRPDMETGFFASFIHTPSPVEHIETTVKLGVVKFTRPAQNPEGSDA